VTPVQFTIGRAHALLASARVQDEYRSHEGKEPEPNFSIHRRRQYCARAQLNKILFMRVLILGGTRFIGWHIASALRNEGHHVATFHRGSSEVKRERNKRIRYERNRLARFGLRTPAYNP
jgi:hypothetical protein